MTGHGWDQIHQAREEVQTSLASIVDRDDLFSEATRRRIVSRLIAHSAVVVERLQSVEEAERPRLQQQRTAETDSVTWWLEELAYHNRAAEEAEVALRGMGANPKDFDPDARDIDREDDRRRAARQDERAAENAPRVAS